MTQEEAQDMEVLTDLPGITNDNALRINKGLVCDTFHVPPMSYPEFGQMVYVDNLVTAGVGWLQTFHKPTLSEFRTRNPDLFRMYHQKRVHPKVRAHITSNVMMVGQIVGFWSLANSTPFPVSIDSQPDFARWVSCLPPSQVVWADLGGSFVMELEIPWLIPKNCIDQNDATGEPYTDAQLDNLYPFPSFNLYSIGDVLAPAGFTPWSIRFSEEWVVETGAPTMSNSAALY